MEDAVKILNHRGLIIKIYQDEDYQSPEEWGDDSVFLVNYHHDFEVKKDEIITEDDVRDWYQGKKIKQTKDYYIFMLSCLVHSGVWLSLDYNFACDSGGWDTSHVGVVLVSKKEAKTKTKARKLAETLIDEWNDNLSGNVYGYVIENEDEENLGSCWGFYGDIETSGIIKEAISETERIADKRMKKHLEKAKAQIKNKVPLEKRTLIKT